MAALRSLAMSATILRRRDLTFQNLELPNPYISTNNCLPKFVAKRVTSSLFEVNMFLILTKYRLGAKELKKL
jgi:hypothetical protein